MPRTRKSIVHSEKWIETSIDNVFPKRPWSRYFQEKPLEKALVFLEEPFEKRVGISQIKTEVRPTNEESAL